ncbi:MAG: hypothetical protein NTW19_01505 [Planctomycetota bacterium]|nr:hypothetical protein [Planctomycetota bacterium]
MKFTVNEPIATDNFFVGRVDFNNGSTSATASVPGNAVVERSNNPMVLTFVYKDQDNKPQTLSATIPSTETGWIAGNTGIAIATLGVGIIGAVVDGITNSSREYPEEFILNVRDKRLVMRYEDNKKFFIYDEAEKKFYLSDRAGNRVAPAASQPATTQRAGN